MQRIDEIIRLLLECTPVERAEAMRIVRGKMVESRKGMLTRDDFSRVIASTANLGLAAKELGICRRSLQYHMRLFGLPPGGKQAGDAG